MTSSSFETMEITEVDVNENIKPTPCQVVEDLKWMADEYEQLNTEYHSILESNETLQKELSKVKHERNEILTEYSGLVGELSSLDISSPTKPDFTKSKSMSSFFNLCDSNKSGDKVLSNSRPKSDPVKILDILKENKTNKIVLDDNIGRSRDMLAELDDDWSVSPDSTSEVTDASDLEWDIEGDLESGFIGSCPSLEMAMPQENMCHDWHVPHSNSLPDMKYYSKQMESSPNKSVPNFPPHFQGDHALLSCMTSLQNYIKKHVQDTQLQNTDNIVQQVCKVLQTNVDFRRQTDSINSETDKNVLSVEKQKHSLSVGLGLQTNMAVTQERSILNHMLRITVRLLQSITNKTTALETELLKAEHNLPTSSDIIKGTIKGAILLQWKATRLCLKTATFPLRHPMKSMRRTSDAVVFVPLALGNYVKGGIYTALSWPS